MLETLHQKNPRRLIRRLAIAADRAAIMAHSTSHDSELPNRDFYVLLSNVSKQPQMVWEDWNGWGYYSISFELTTTDGKKYVLSKRQAAFTKNYPSTIVIEPGEHVIYPVHLNEWWETRPSLPKAQELPITLKAIYEISPTPESAQYKVWTGRVESHTYNFTLRQWQVSSMSSEYWRKFLVSHCLPDIMCRGSVSVSGNRVL